MEAVLFKHYLHNELECITFFVRDTMCISNEASAFNRTLLRSTHCAPLGSSESLLVFVQKHILAL